MTFDDLVMAVNDVCLAAFGKTFTFTPALTGAPQVIVGILDAGVEPEDLPPGDGSTYARLWFQNSIDPPPEKGDEISNSTTVYKIVRLEQDAGGGLWMLLRQDRMI